MVQVGQQIEDFEFEEPGCAVILALTWKISGYPWQIGGPARRRSDRT